MSDCVGKATQPFMVLRLPVNNFSDEIITPRLVYLWFNDLYL